MGTATGRESVGSTEGPRDPNVVVDRVIEGDARQAMLDLPAGIADTVITSPPYFRQRDYEDQRQIGQEASPAEYVRSLVDTLSAARHVLKASGSLWLVLGDKYDRGRLLGMPWRVAIAMQDDGWILRSDVIWHKPNAMPSSVKSRPTTDHEYVFFFTVNNEYYYDADAIREPHVTFSEKSRMRGGRKHLGQRGGTPEKGKNSGNSNLHDGRWDQAFHPKGRNKRTVWSIPLSKCREAHFAVFPEPLVSTCLSATCPPKGLVVDPFAGSGTTALVAQKLNRHFLAIDCSSSYCDLIRRRLLQESTKASGGNRPTRKVVPASREPG